MDTQVIQMRLLLFFLQASQASSASQAELIFLTFKGCYEQFEAWDLRECLAMLKKQA